MPFKDLKKIVGSNPQINACTHNLVSYSEDKLTVLGTATLPVKSKTDVEHELTFHIVETNQPGLLGLTASQDLGLIKVVMVAKTEDKQIEPDKSEEVTKLSEELKEEVLQKYTQVFTGLGRLEKPYHIEVDPTVTPVVNPPRMVPAALRDRVEEELDDMERRGVVRKVEEPTDWANSMAIVEKPNGSLRICLDPRHLNKAIKREHFQLPTTEDITTRMANAKWFTKLDANRGYWQIPHDEESQLLTTFNTPFGRYCYQVTPFGITRSLTDAESRYAQIEKELLAVQFSLERFHQYIYGKKVTIESDHKPLEAIVKKALASAPPRLQRILLRMQKYDYTLEYKPGKELVLPDMLSRAPLPETAYGSMEEEIALHVHLLTSNLPVSKPKLEEIKEATANDPSLKELKDAIKSGWPETKSCTPASIQVYWNVRDELSEVEGVILKNDRILVPSSMRKEMLQRIHQGHMGIEKSKRRARDVLYWPGMNSQISDMISRCTTYLEHQRQNTKEPMIPSRLPHKPWEMVPTDLFT